MNQAKKILSIMTVATLVVVGAYVFVFLQVRKASRETAAAEQMIQEELEKRSKEDSISNLFAATEEEREELYLRVATKGALVGFFEEIEVLATEAEVDMRIARIEENVELDQVVPKTSGDERPKPRAHPAAKDIEWMRMDIEAHGSWENAYKFLSFLELLPYHTELYDIRLVEETSNVTSEEEGPILNNWRLTLSIKLLQQKEG